MDLWAFVSGTWKFLIVLFFFFFLNFSSHSYVFFLVYPWGENYFIEDPRGRFCQHYTEVSIIIVYCETRNCKNRIHVFYVGYSRSHRVFNFIGALRLDDSGYQLNQECPSMQYLSYSRNRYGTYIKSRSFHSTSLAHRLSGTQHMYPTPRGGGFGRMAGRTDGPCSHPHATYIDSCYLPKDLTTKIRSPSKIKSSRSWRAVKMMGVSR